MRLVGYYNNVMTERVQSIRHSCPFSYYNMLKRAGVRTIQVLFNQNERHEVHHSYWCSQSWRTFTLHLDTTLKLCYEFSLIHPIFKHWEQQRMAIISISSGNRTATSLRIWIKGLKKWCFSYKSHLLVSYSYKQFQVHNYNIFFILRPTRIILERNSAKANIKLIQTKPRAMPMHFCCLFEGGITGLISSSN